jgi:hypothetical protein
MVVIVHHLGHNRLAVGMGNMTTFCSQLTR